MPTEIQAVNYIVIHCSATPADRDITEEEIRRWHKKRGWRDIGYHVVIRRGGMVEFGRPLDVRGAHVRGRNHDSVGVCLIGGVTKLNKPENNYTDAQWASLDRVVFGLKAFFPEAEVLGHRDFPGVFKACPCFPVKDWWASKITPWSSNQKVCL
jgi:hypothetical protein